jgi:hypothetical protein
MNAQQIVKMIGRPSVGEKPSFVFEVGKIPSQNWNRPDNNLIGPRHDGLHQDTDSSQTSTRKGQRSGELSGAVGFATQGLRVKTA